MTKLLFSFIFFVCSLSSLQQNKNRAEAYAYAHQCINVIANIKMLSYTMAKKERVNGVLSEQKVNVKLSTDPFRVYIKQVFPKAGLEVLYPYGEHKKALINPNGFPWVSVALDPLGSKMRDGQHHNVLRSGFGFTGRIIENLLDHASEGLLKNVSYEGLVTIEKKHYRKLVVETNFQWQSYTVRDEKSLVEIAEKMHLNDYLILEHNPAIDDFDDISEGQKIEVPNAYAKKMELYLDQTTLLPMIIKIYDDLGLYEHYTYSNLILNGTILDEEFDRHYEAYDF